MTATVTVFNIPEAILYQNLRIVRYSDTLANPDRVTVTTDICAYWLRKAFFTSLQ